MRWKNNKNRYSSLSIAMHWLMLILIIAVYSTIELRELFAKGSDPRDMLKSFHFMLGISVFVLVWIRDKHPVSGRFYRDIATSFSGSEQKLWRINFSWQGRVISRAKA